MSNLSDLLGGSGGAIELISTTTVSGTPSTIDITSGFSSTYDNYFIYADDVTLPSSNSFNMRVYKSASLLTSADYSYTTRTGSSQFSQTSFEIAYYDSSAGSAGFRVEIVNVNSSAFAISSNSLFRAVINGYNYSGSGSVTGVRIYPASGNFTAGSFRLYGIKKS